MDWGAIYCTIHISCCPAQYSCKSDRKWTISLLNIELLDVHDSLLAAATLGHSGLAAAIFIQVHKFMLDSLSVTDIYIGWHQDNGNRSIQESRFDFLATRQCLVKVVKGQQKIKINHTN